MPKCLLCGADGPGATCASCRPAPAVPPGEAPGGPAAPLPPAEPPTAEAPPAVETLTPLPSPAAPEPATGNVAAPRRVFEIEDETGPVALARWNSILDESPVFAGQGDFEVQKPAAFPAGALQIGLQARFEVDSAPADTDPIVHMLVTASPFGAPLMAGRNGPVAHVILALDVSASMNRPDKYPLLVEALRGMFRELRGKWAHEVLVSVVAFAWGTETLVHAVPSSALDEREVLGRLEAWNGRFTRYTDVVGALHRAGRIAYDSVRANKSMPVRIHLLTDGRPQDLAGAREVAARIAKLPVDVHGLAFGDDADVAALGQLVLGGRGGTVKHVRSDTIGDAFGRIGEVAQLVVANRAILDVELRPGVTGGAAYRYRPARHRYPRNAFARGAHFSADLGTLESGRAYSLLFQLRLRRTRTPETEVGRIVLRVPGHGGPRTFELPASIRRHSGTTMPNRDPEVQAAMDVLAALEGDDPEATLRALRVRREIYAREHRDAHVIFVIDKAIVELERHGSLSGLTAAEHATLVSHTLTRHVRGGRLPAAGARATEAGRTATAAAGGPAGA